MDKYVILDHKADLKIKSFGRTRKELFLNMMRGMEDSQQAEISADKQRVKRKIKVKGPDSKALLVDFLNECLYLSSVKKEVYNGIDFRKFSAELIEGELKGRKAARFGRDIKAATYHGLNVRKKGEGLWEAVVLFDI